MKLEIEVKRRRFSVTQGQADVYVNGGNGNFFRRYNRDHQ